jgi:hypothetical protein
MSTIWKFLKFTLAFFVLILVIWGLVANYSVIFSKTVIGEITAVERVELPGMLMTRSDAVTSKVFSFAIGIKDAKTGEIFTASSEDRQWAVAMPGQCAEAVFLPYPFWELTKKDTYFGARLVKLYECKK